MNDTPSSDFKNLQSATYIINTIQNRLAQNTSCEREISINEEIVGNIQEYLNDKERGRVSNNMEIVKEAIFHACTNSSIGENKQLIAKQ